MGGAIAMDDFGTGYSSLSYLRRFPFDKIKIDQSFVSELGQRGDSVAIVRAATGLAAALGMETVAEGIETEEQLALVAAEGCAEAQGYLFSRPMPAADVLGFLDVQPRQVADRVVMLSPPQRNGAASESSRLAARVTPTPPIWRDGRVVAATGSLSKAARSPER
jgi:predicted signal transduction protein with EAL and GGDEF domain